MSVRRTFHLLVLQASEQEEDCILGNNPNVPGS